MTFLTLLQSNFETGGKGDSERRRRTIFKPTGLTELRKVPEGRKDVDERAADTALIAAGIAAKLSQEQADDDLAIIMVLVAIAVSHN